MTTSTKQYKSGLTKSYWSNLFDAFLGIETVRETQVEVPTEVIKKDPRGLVAREMELLKSWTGGAYQLGDSIESVAFREGQLNVIRVIETKLIAKPQGTLDNYELIQ